MIENTLALQKPIMSADILVVEDNPMTDGALALSIKERRHRVTMAASLMETKKWLSARYFDLVLLDIDMTSMDGSEFLEWTKNRWPHLPILVLTGPNNPRGTLTSPREGTLQYLPRHTETGTFRLTIRRILSQQAPISAWNQHRALSEVSNHA